MTYDEARDEAYLLVEAKHQAIIDKEYARFLKRSFVEKSPEEKEAQRFRKNARKMVPPDFSLEEIERAASIMEDLK